MKWWRTYNGASSNAKFLAIANRVGSDCQPGHVAAVWLALQDCASQASKRGSVADFDVEAVAAFYQWPEDLVQRIKEAFEAKGHIADDRFTDWETWQHEKQDRTRAERQRRFRERRKAEEEAKKKAASAPHISGEYVTDVTPLHNASDVTVTNNGPKRRGDTCISEPLQQETDSSLKLDASRSTRMQALAFGDVTQVLQAEGVALSAIARWTSNSTIKAWVQQGITGEQLDQAIKRARRRREHDHDDRPLNPRFIGCFVDDVLAGRPEQSTTRGNDHGDHLGREFIAGG